jgi:ribosomal protein L12E/L44/L45/RPP1/RPP2
VNLIESRGFSISEAACRSALASIDIEFADIDALIASLENVDMEFGP